jgi:hypothetical protein
MRLPREIYQKILVSVSYLERHQRRAVDWLTSDVSAGRSITVVDYDPAWSIEFESLQSIILSAVGDIAVAV